MHNIDYATIRKMHTAARLERSAYVHAQLRRLAVWLAGLFAGRVDSASALGVEACC